MSIALEITLIILSALFFIAMDRYTAGCERV